MTSCAEARRAARRTEPIGAGTAGQRVVAGTAVEVVVAVAAVRACRSPSPPGERVGARRRRSVCRCHRRRRGSRRRRRPLMMSLPPKPLMNSPALRALERVVAGRADERRKQHPHLREIRERQAVQLDRIRGVDAAATRLAHFALRAPETASRLVNSRTCCKLSVSSATEKSVIDVHAEIGRRDPESSVLSKWNVSAPAPPVKVSSFSRPHS